MFSIFCFIFPIYSQTFLQPPPLRPKHGRLLLTGGRCSEVLNTIRFNMGPQNSGCCNTWSLLRGGLHRRFDCIQIYQENWYFFQQNGIKVCFSTDTLQNSLFHFKKRKITFHIENKYFDETLLIK